MKWMKAVLCGVLLGVAGTAASSDEAREQPLDYRQGLMLETSGASPWYRVELPPTIYQGTAWPDLRDVRVFNHQGETVPFALQAQKVQPAMPETMALRLFPLQMSLVPPREESRRGVESLLLRSTTGIEIRLETEDVKALGQSYLLTLPVDKTDAFALAQLRLNWESLAANWQGKASLYSSRDLKYWHPVQEDAPLMDLARDNDRLKMDTISASTTTPNISAPHTSSVFQLLCCSVAVVAVNRASPPSVTSSCATARGRSCTACALRSDGGISMSRATSAFCAARFPQASI